MPTPTEKLVARAEEVQSEMCCIEHPIYKILCLRNIGHPGQHWFMVRWHDRKQALEDAVAALNAIIE